MDTTLLHTVLLPLRNYPFQLTATPVAVAESMAINHALPLHRLPRVPRDPLKNTMTMSISSLGHYSCCARCQMHEKPNLGFDPACLFILLNFSKLGSSCRSWASISIPSYCVTFLMKWPHHQKPPIPSPFNLNNTTFCLSR